MKIWVYSLFLLVFLFGCSNSDSLQRICPAKCPYPFNVEREIKEDLAGVGVCKRGKPVCDENFNIIDCEGQILPDIEICDGIDNDCDGSIDEFLAPMKNWDWKQTYGENPCFYTRGECNNATIYCEGGWVCEYGNTIEFPDEISCDNKDNDCDGLIDEGLFIGQFCYEVSEDLWWTASNDPCRPGVYVCEYGRRICSGQVLPEPEICDFIDNDCNGVVDDTGKTLQEKYDIVFIVDTSGSMSNSINAVAIALDLYSSQFVGNPNFQFAVIEIASLYNYSTYPYISVLANFSDLSVVHSTLTSLSNNNTGIESSLDGPYLVCDIAENPLELLWREDANPMFMEFTDEEAQSYINPVVSVSDVVDMCVNNGVVGYIWSYSSFDFNPIAVNTGGKHFTLTTNINQLFNDLNTIIEEICID